MFFLSLVFSLIFIIYIPSFKDSPIDDSSGTPPFDASLIGEITGPINYKEKVIEFTFQTKPPQKNFLAIYFPDNNEDSFIKQYSKLQTGATCEISGQVTIPEKSSNPGQFNYQSFLKKQGIEQQLIINSVDDIYCEGHSFLGKVYSIRNSIQENIINTYSADTAAWMVALVLGNDRYIEGDTIELFRRWGLSHLLAISGLHVGLIIGLVYFILINTGLMTKEKSQWFMIFFLPLYALVAGGEPSVWRACLMAFLFIVLRKLKLKLTITDVISIVFIILIVVDKHIVYHVGFQFSFLVTFSIILSGTWLTNNSSLLFQMLKISFISQMVILPLQFAYFSMVQPASILLNVLVVPYFSFFVIPAMFLMSILSLVPLLPNMFDYLFSKIHLTLLDLLTHIDNTMNYSWVSGPLPLTFIILYYCLLVLLMSYAMQGKLFRAFNCGILITLMVTLLLLRPYLSPEGSVTMLDIGQGDTFVIELPYRKGVIFMDAGSTFSFVDKDPSDRVYKQIIKPYLYSRGIQRIDAILISHEHIDHMGSVDFLIEEFDTNQIVISNYYELDEEMAKNWIKHGVELSRVEGGEQIVINGQTFNILSPFKDIISGNDNSLVAFTELGGKNWLFTGDIESDAEKELAKRYSNLSVDVLKVAHHGSDTSSDALFIEQIKPSYALISVGESNSYGHPASSVIENLNEMQIPIMRTDESGAVIYKFKENNGTFYHYSP